MQCTLNEIAGWFECSPDTIERRVKEVHGINFADYFGQKRGKGKIALRRKQMQVALSGNTTLLIWLGKQYLGQSDKQIYDQQSLPSESKLVIDLSAASDNDSDK